MPFTNNKRALAIAAGARLLVNGRIVPCYLSSSARFAAIISSVTV